MSSNYVEIVADLAALAEVANLDAPGSSGHSFGDELIDAAADAMRERSLSGVGPNADFWPYNSPETSRRKGGKPVGVDSGEMLSTEEFRGRRQIGSHEATWEYGKNPASVQKLGYFQDGGHGRPPREVIGVDELTDERMDAVAGEHLARRVDDLESKP